MSMRERSLLLAVCAFAFAARVQSAPMEESQEPAEPADVVGEVQFETSCAEEVHEEFNKAVALLHSFEFDESRQMFEGIASRDPECAMAHWGVAMTHYQQWNPPSDEAVKLGSEAVARARALEATEREKLYIEATGAYFDGETTTWEQRATRFERAMAGLHEKFPDDEEAEIFYALVMLSGADPRDKTYAVQKRTGAMLEPLFADMPNHPGVAHYIIHSYDYPSLADRAVDAAHRYLDIATSMPHALHMSGHIFTQVGMWEDCIDANVRSAEAARERFDRTGLEYYKGDEIHAYDYLVYAYLQRGQDEKARAIVDHVQSRTDLDWTDPTNAFNAGAAPARYALERRDWEGAASLEPFLVGEKVEGNFQARMSAPVRYWARAIGAARSGRIEQAENDLAELEKRTKEFENHETVWARHTAEVLRLQASAWLALAKDEKDRALELMTAAAELESQTDKSGVSPGRVLPAHEQLGDMLAELDRPEEALAAYETSMLAAPRRFNTYLGAARAAKDAGKPELARDYYAKLLELASEDSTRPALEEARAAGGDKTAG